MLNLVLNLFNIACLFLLFFINRGLIKQRAEQENALMLLTTLIGEMRNCQNCKQSARICDGVYEECFSGNYKFWEMVNVDLGKDEIQLEINSFNKPE